MRKAFTFGKVAYTGNRKLYLVEVEIELDCGDENKPVFTASAGIWNASHTDYVMCGQCLDSIWQDFKSQINNPGLYKKILGLWQRNHLNDMNAGCEFQRLENWHNGYIGVPCPMCGYKYGTAWKYRTISASDLQAIKALLGVEHYHVVLSNHVLFTGTENECFIWLLKHQSCSVDHALKYEGYSIELVNKGL